MNDHLPRPELVATGGPGTGVVDGLLHPAPGEEPLTPVEIVFHCVQLILAGTDTTGSLITNLLRELLVDRRRWERLVDEPGLIPRAVEESLRHDAPLQYVLRTVTTDEEVWGDDPGDFSLDRHTTRATMAFGYGIHTCLGPPWPGWRRNSCWRRWSRGSRRSASPPPTAGSPLSGRW